MLGFVKIVVGFFINKILYKNRLLRDCLFMTPKKTNAKINAELEKCHYICVVFMFANKGNMDSLVDAAKILA